MPWSYDACYLMMLDVGGWSLTRLCFLCRMPHVLYLRRICKQLLALNRCRLVLKLHAGRKLSEEPVCKAWNHVHMRLPGNCHTIGRRELWCLWHLVSMASCSIVYDVFTRNGKRKVWSCWWLDLQLEDIFSHGRFVELSWTVHLLLRTVSLPATSCYKLLTISNEKRSTSGPVAVASIPSLRYRNTTHPFIWMIP